MKNLILLSVLISAFSIQALFSQTYVSTNPQDKNVILEEFTGVRCPNCPQGHQVAQQILENNPGRVWAVAFHPHNSNYTTPYSGDPDFRRHHPDSLYMIPYCGSSRFMPSAYINRRIYGGERIQSRASWEGFTNEFLNEASPVNIGLATTYDEITKQLTILVEIYYTENVMDLNTLNVLFTESGMVAQQSGGSSSYVHHHVFRETFTAQWGNQITESTTQGSFIQKSFSFDNSADEYNMDECEIVAYIVNAETEEILSGIGVHAGGNTATTSTQNISLNNGFQFVSSSLIQSDPDMMVVLAEILNENLIFVRSSNGSVLRKIGPNWVNGIGDWNTAEGYLFKMAASEEFVVEGTPIDPQSPINIDMVFQFISYYPEISMNALDAFANILTDKLDFIRNSQGQLIRKIGPNWVNGIGNCNPGQGYLIKMHEADILIYPAE